LSRSRVHRGFALGQFDKCIDRRAGNPDADARQHGREGRDQWRPKERTRLQRFGRERGQRVFLGHEEVADLEIAAASAA
jgi:hypothetical protein